MVIWVQNNIVTQFFKNPFHMIQKYLSVIVFCLLISPLSGQSRIHPFSLVSADELTIIRQKTTLEPYSGMLQKLKVSEQELSSREPSVYHQASLIRNRAFLYALTGHESWAQQCFEEVLRIAADTVFIPDPFSFGLTRAVILRDLTLAYDFAYQGWSKEQRVRVADLVFELMKSVSANMGQQANYRLESNWMGVRYGSALLAAVVLNDELNRSLGRENIILAHLWDLKERMRDHIHASHTDGGWFVETMGYHVYDGQFVWPAIIAYQNRYREGVIDLEEYAPRLLQAYGQHITGTIAIQTVNGIGIKPDLANDNKMLGFTPWPLWQRILSPSVRPYIAWMHDYFYTAGEVQPAPDLFYSILFHDEKQGKVNPATGGFLNYLEKEVGVLMFRNEFKDSADIVATFNTSARRFPGHSGPDNLTFRITGLGGIWAVGVGRTGNPTGQTALFPAAGSINLPRPLPAGRLEKHHFTGQRGSGYAIGSGSCMGVDNHTRLFWADYTEQSGAKGVFVVKDVTDNGRIWRMHTPGFNKIENLPDGVMIIAPNGASMKITTPGNAQPAIHIGEVRYGGETVRHNPGVHYYGKSYFDNHLIDIECDNDILVVMTLQEPGKKHPDVTVNRRATRIKVGNLSLSVPDLKKL